jgi:hypothetical protein
MKKEIERDEARLGRDGGLFFPGRKQHASRGPTPISTLHGVVFAILCLGLRCTADRVSNTLVEALCPGDRWCC